MRRTRGITLQAVAAATVLSACSVSVSAPPGEVTDAAQQTRTPVPTRTPPPTTTPAPTETAPTRADRTPAPKPRPTAKGTPVARGMVFGGDGKEVAVEAVSDQVVQSKEWKRISRFRNRVEEIAEELQGKAPKEQAELTGTAADFGSFSYTYSADGSIQPDPAWVSEYIRTESVPILGSVTCHKLMIPQLRGALQQVVNSGLSDAINPEEFAGCYVPRFIASDPSNPVSLHTWGIAVDLNVPGNLRGTAGEIDRRVVQIFKAWGFAWGGDWDYTDPMHFELATLY